MKPVARVPVTRLQGFDLARGLSIFGMVLVHFVLVMTLDTPPSEWGRRFLDTLDGRPAMTFMLLAGVGVSLMARKAAALGDHPDALDRRLRRRGLFLLACGFLNLIVWPGDILRVYGVSIWLAPWCVRRSSRSLLLIAGAFVCASVVLMFMADYDRHWDWSTMTYHDLWTPAGLVRNLFYDGFRSVFPWTGCLLFGMWLGRWNWGEPQAAGTAIKWGAATMLVSWMLSTLILRWIAAHPQPDLRSEDAVALFGLLSMPPLPLFILNAGGFALLMIGACTLVAKRWPGALFVRGASAAGRLAFTWYVGHIFIGLGTVDALGWTGASHGTALATGCAFCALAAMLSIRLLRRFRTGPLEWLLRRIG